MANYFYEEQQHDKNLHNNYFDVAKSSTLDVLGQTFSETLYYNPANALVRLSEQYTEGDKGKVLTQEEWKESEYFRDGIKVEEEGITEGLAKLFAERKDKRDSFNLTLSRSRGGFGLGAAQFGVAIAGSLIDPLNIASAFVPAIGVARTATLAAKFGKNGGRFLAGAANGMVGAAILEPIVLGAAYAEQDDDYNLMDSFLNVTVGGVLGGGMHLGFGKISDRIEASSQELKDKAYLLSVEQAAEDQAITAGDLHIITDNKVAESLIKRSRMARDFDPEVRSQTDVLDPKTGEVIKTETIKDTQITKPEGLPDPESQFFDITKEPKWERKGTANPEILRTKKPQTLKQFIIKNGGINTNDPDISEIHKVIGGKQNAKEYTRKGGKSVNEMMELARENGYFSEAIADSVDEFSPNDFFNAIEEDRIVGKFSSADEGKIVDFEKAKELEAIADRYGIDPKGMSNETFYAALDNAMKREDYYDYNTSTTKGDLTEQQYKDLGDEAAVTNTYLGAMRDQKNIVDEMEAEGMTFEGTLLADVVSENALLEADLQGLRTANLLPEDFEAEIKAADDLISKATSSYSEATRAGAACLITNMRNLK
tara:strand:- start:2547 stop:4337 length:1791 start_codon:yes stop_codon:yes gene_type:complete